MVQVDLSLEELKILTHILGELNEDSFGHSQEDKLESKLDEIERLEHLRLKELENK